MTADTTTTLDADTAVLRVDLSSADFFDKVHGCWIGKNAGGTLGTPIEEALGREEPFDIWWYPELREGGLPNDDLEMQLVWLAALENVGPTLTARDLARYWLDHIGYNFDEYGLSKTNLRLGLVPPVSGAFNNWFVDCMGCPIRTEIWACVAPGAPRVAARYAYEDAICDHAGGESVYGSLFNVALQSSAFVLSDHRTLIDIALSYVPDDSLTAKAVRTAVAAFDEGVDWKEARRRVLRATPSHVAQYSPINIGFQVIGLLYGKDFGDALCITVNCGYDTDSSTGTTGSWWGIIDGARALPARWIEPFGDDISTNESWGGVRHLTDGTADIPADLPAVVSRVAGAARRVLGAAGLLDGDALTVDLASLYADDSVRALWTKDPMTVEYDASEFSVRITYPEGPAASAGASLSVVVGVDNPHPDPVEGTLSVWVPDGWPQPGAQRVRIPALQHVDVPLSIATPERAVLENTNRLFVAFQADGYPAEPAVPLPVIGAAAIEVSPAFALTAGSSLEQLQQDYVDEALLALPRPIEGWTIESMPTNAIPESALPAPGTARYVRFFIDAPAPIGTRIGVDAGSPVRAWLNGDLLVSENRHRPIRPSYAGATDGYTDTTLQRGGNILTVQLVRAADDDPVECHLLLSTSDVLHDGLIDAARTRLPWD